MHKVKKILHVEDYKLILEFDDGNLKLVDLEDEIWGPVFEPLKNLEYFKQVEVKSGTLIWPNEADFCPDVLYKIGKEIHEQKKQPKPKIRRRKQISSEKTEFKILASAKAKKVLKKTKSKQR